MSVVDVYSVEQFRNIMSEDILTVAWFTAVWCGPCKTIERPMEKIAYEFPTVKFAKVDADNNSEIVSKCRVLQLPTFIIARSGKMLGHVIGANPGMLRQKLRDIIKDN
ncbi:thioredoxin [Trypanosoma equiperdum]|uniref:Thioredoxin n=4 Tax=Trypanozoon TaxID=39700 RepID=Q38FJ1_TRYB2|nr:thioredoxin [Trypanosoma brucei gambiense DAL972]XP_803641.1 thioredoxin [Trypanosoma brucei brucei TREU927]CAB81781.1 thioredoxin [Trypanosoma brucei brucei]SCU69836.1 thioredoxin [Trypanosoma equiperdum]EAN76429.1 thioredoxin [Trypanosoma brucei brucei TREU927]CBH14094.1 thioredoxin [Trypanosoma brucei gambiense DAL972]|eukprot:XP_011776365.1 thioredoxin [Trypanosoma brucei gambiense DAL972]